MDKCNRIEVKEILNLKTEEEVLNLKNYEDNQIKIIETKKEILKGSNYSYLKVGILIKKTGEKIYHSGNLEFVKDKLAYLFYDITSGKTIGFSGGLVAYLINKSSHKDYIILKTCEDTLNINGFTSKFKKVTTGRIIPKKHFKDFIEIYEGMKGVLTNVIGVESLNTISECTENLFSDWL